MTPDTPDECPTLSSLIWPEETRVLIQAVEEGLSGKKQHIAVLSEFLAGRENLVSQVACAYPDRIARITLNTFITDNSLFARLPETDIIILENCQFLFRRMVGGFTFLSSFIDTLSSHDKMWITTWNIHSWRYLNAIRSLELLFPLQIILGQKSHEEVKNFILSQYSSPIFYLIDVPVPKRLIILHHRKQISVPFTENLLNVPYFTINTPLLSAMLRGKSHEAEPDKLIFERLTQISNGNPGIAKKIWEKALDAWEIRMSAFSPIPINGISDSDTAYILTLLLYYEQISIHDLQTIISDEVRLPLVLSKLHDTNLVYEKDKQIFISLRAISEITHEMKQLRMVW
jgi:hypothetical protein